MPITASASADSPVIAMSNPSSAAMARPAPLWGDGVKVRRGRGSSRSNTQPRAKKTTIRPSP
jgi:hypothetical protein